MTRSRNDVRDILLPLVFALGVAGCGLYAMFFAVLYDVPCRMGSGRACAMLDLYGGVGAAASFGGVLVAGVLFLAPFVHHALRRLHRATR